MFKIGFSLILFFQVNSILEAFGHAKTPMNANGSRFIKLLSLQYNEKRRTLLRGLCLVHSKI